MIGQWITAFITLAALVGCGVGRYSTPTATLQQGKGKPSPSHSPIPTASPTPSVSPSPIVSPVPSPLPSASPVSSPLPTISPVPSPSPIVSPVPSPLPSVPPVPSPSPIVSPVPSPSPSPIPPVSGVFHSFPQREWYILQGVDAIGSIKNSELTQPGIDGLSVRVAWATIHPAVGTYNFSSIRAELSRVKSLGKLMQLRVMSGPLAPAWLKDRGVRYLGAIPHPQDDKVLDYWEQLHIELGKEFGNERTIVIEHASGISPESAEWLYNANTSPNLYSQSDFDGPKMTSNWIRAIQIEARAFPNAIISANLGDHDRDWVKNTIRELKRLLPLQVAFQINSLSAKIPTTWLGFQNIQNAGNEGYHSGFQMLCGSDQVDRFGGSWASMLTKFMATKAQWNEIYRSDIGQSKPRNY